MQPPLSRMPLLPVAVGIVAGIVCEAQLAQAAVFGVLGLCVLAALALGLRGRLWWAVAMASVCVGVCVAIVHTPAPFSPEMSQKRERTGLVTNLSEGDSHRSMVVSHRGVNFYLVTMTFLPEVEEGDSVRFVASLHPADCNAPTLSDCGWQPALMRGLNVTAAGYVEHNTLEVTGRSDSWLWRLRRWGGVITAKIVSSSLDPQTSALLATVLMGDRTALSPAQRSRWSAAGVAHLLAISGMHAALVAMIAASVIWVLLLGQSRVWPMVLALPVVWAYAVIAGLTPSVVRAAVMTTLVAGSYLLQRSRSGVNSLCFAVIVILVATPRALFAVGFQLSVLAVAAILVWGEFSRSLEYKRHWVKTAVDLLALPFVAMLATGLVAAHYFHSLPLLFMLTNVPLALMFPVLMGLGMLWLALMLIGVGCPPLDFAVNHLCGLMDALVDAVSRLPFSAMSPLYFSPWALALWGGALLALAVWVYGRSDQPYRRSRGIVWLAATAMLMVAAVAVVAVPPRAVRAEYYLLPNRSRAELLVNNRGDVSLITTAQTPADREYALKRAKQQYDGYLGMRRTRPLELWPTAEGRVEIGSDRWLIVASDSVASQPGDVDYLLVCGGFKGDVVSLARRVRPGLVVLSPDLHPRRRQRYARELAHAGIAAHVSENAPVRFELR